MNVSKKSVAETPREERVLEITEREFKEIMSEVHKTCAEHDLDMTKDAPEIGLLLAISYASFAGRLHRRLFKLEEEKQNGDT